MIWNRPLLPRGVQRKQQTDGVNTLPIAQLGRCRSGRVQFPGDYVLYFGSMVEA
jgi:hypothetical protein